MKESRAKKYTPSDEPFDPIRRSIWGNQAKLRVQAIFDVQDEKGFLEILLVAMAYNINKLHAKIQQNRTWTQLFEKTFGLVPK